MLTLMVTVLGVMGLAACQDGTGETTTSASHTTSSIPVDTAEAAEELLAASREESVPGVMEHIQEDTSVIFGEPDDMANYLADTETVQDAAQSFWLDQIETGEEPFEGLERVLASEPTFSEGHIVYPRWATMDLSDLEDDERSRLLEEFPECGPAWLEIGAYEGPIVKFTTDGLLVEIKTVGT